MENLGMNQVFSLFLDISNSICIQYGETDIAIAGTVYLPVSYVGTYSVAYSTYGDRDNFHFAVATTDRKLSYFTWSSYQRTHQRGWITIGF